MLNTYVAIFTWISVDGVRKFDLHGVQNVRHKDSVASPRYGAMGTKLRENNSSHTENNTKLDGCIVRNAHNTVFDSKRSAICAQAVYFLCLVSRDSIVDGDWLPVTE